MGITAVSTGRMKARPLFGSALAPAAVGLVLAIVLIVIVGSTAFADSRLALLLGYLCVWVPLLGAVVAAVGRRGAARWVRYLRLSVRPIDLIWGLGVGLLARTVASLIEIWGYGSVGSAGVRFGETVYDAWWLFGTLLAPVLLAPVIEEVFFRGLVLRAIYSEVSGARAPSIGKFHDRPGSTPLQPDMSRMYRSHVPHGRTGGHLAAMIAVGVSGLTFALMHLVSIDLGSAATVAVVWSSTLSFGLAVAWLSLATGRIGGAIIAHVTFNALAIVPALL
ncbi:CPBP family intramembrane glutamic endopeptidase [Cryobacterium ruanii]|uniref:CPBP family intramembrane metalloprotease n=1 Tax=Cryobacterium ruanii TaxID=1259197 RepID=A0A4V3ITF6_9MICO|nr:CPBP family intramembrane glutamic endopeptidase [Cryobacterium ruanii]TFD66492.1 CPBP family intramembrane metalloprotease [Cryobacterium ruanii]